jgi:hypothetical protein
LSDIRRIPSSFEDQDRPLITGTDVAAIADVRLSITPIHVNMTHARCPAAKHAFYASRASDRGHQAVVRLCQSALSRAEQNLHRLLVTCALENLFMARRHLWRCQPA